MKLNAPKKRCLQTVSSKYKALGLTNRGLNIENESKIPKLAQTAKAKLTVPLPFNLSASRKRLSQKENKTSEQIEIEEAHKNRFRAKPAPKFIKRRAEKSNSRVNIS